MTGLTLDLDDVKSLQRGLFIDGDWRGLIDGATAPVINPATEAVIAEVAEGSVADCERAIAAARRAFDEGPWPRLPRVERARTIERLRDAIAARQHQIAALCVAEVGTPQALAYGLHVSMPVQQLDFVAEFARRDPTQALPTMVTHRPNGGKLLGAQVKVHEPLGVVTAITPFNSPFYLNISKIGPALAMGNTVVLKPSPLTPLEALILGEIAQEIDLPPGVLNVVTGGPDVGEMLTTDPRVDMVSFTGSDVIGAAVMAQASRTLKRVLLELGGKSALIVRDDADFHAAVTAGAAQAVTLSGQGCANWTRHIVHRSLKEEYVRRLVDVVTAAKLGDPGKDSTVTMGPLISATQRGRVEDYVDSGRRDGAVVMCGGRRPTNLAKGFFYEPTVLDEVDNRWKVAQEEIFGPVVVVLGFDEDDEAIAIANDSQYGLSGAIFSADSGTAYEMALRLRTGGVSINGGAGAITGAAPFGGYRRSGIGRERGDEGMWAYTELKTIGFNAG